MPIFIIFQKTHFQRNLLGVNDSSSDYGVTPFENGSHLPASGGSTPQRNHKARKPRAEVTSREVTCQTDMTRYEMDRLESGQAQKVRFRWKCHFFDKVLGFCWKRRSSSENSSLRRRADNGKRGQNIPLRKVSESHSTTQERTNFKMRAGASRGAKKKYGKQAQARRVEFVS